MNMRQSLSHVVVLGVWSLIAALPLGAGRFADGARAVQRAEGFVPSRDGLGFRNVFKGSPLPAALRDAESGPLRALRAGIGTGLGLPAEFGLCGGMSLTAADYYLAGRTLPDADSPPEQGSPLYEYIYSRQTDSMGQMGAMALKFWRWMNLPDRASRGDSTSKLTALEFPEIVERLRARELVPIGLVLTSTQARGKLWENHQVLAFGLSELEEGNYELAVYDPNFPGDDTVLIKVRKREDGTLSCNRSSRKGTTKVRGLFPMPFQPKVPPRDLAAKA
jgi:hypothetical protein